LTRSDEKIVEHLEEIAIVKDYITIQEDTDSPQKEKSEKTNRKEINSLTPTIRNLSSSAETKTRDNSKKDDLSKSKRNIPNIMIISKENELNLTASPRPITIANNNTIKKGNKKIKKTKKKNNWNTLNEIISNTCFNYLRKEPITITTTKNENTVNNKLNIEKMKILKIKIIIKLQRKKY
jgi:hypothetical protein